MKKTLAAASLAFVACIPILARSAPQNFNQFPSLNNLSKDQLIIVINCMASQASRSVEQCVKSLPQVPGPNATSTPPIATSTPPTATSTVTGMITFLKGDVSTTPKNTLVRQTEGVRNEPMVTFYVQSSGGTSKLTSVTTNASGTIPSTIYLYDGNILIASKAGAYQTVFENLNYIIPTGVTKVLTVKADYPSNTPSRAVGAIGVTGGTYEKSGVKTNVPSIGIWGPINYFFPIVANFNNVSAPTLIAENSRNTTYVAKFNFAANAAGGNVKKLNPADVSIVFTGPGGTYMASGTSVMVSPNADIADGSIAQVNVTAMLPKSMLTTPGLYTASIQSITWSSIQGAVKQTWGLETMKTPSVSVSPTLIER